MIIDNFPVIDEDNRTFEVDNDIDENEEVSISINGLLAFVDDDIEDITDNIITMVEGVEIDWNNDDIAVIYTAID